MKRAETWADMGEWHEVDGVLGVFHEKVDAKAMRSVPPDTPITAKFQVIRQTWDESAHPPTRIIHELEVRG